MKCDDPGCAGSMILKTSTEYGCYRQCDTCSALYRVTPGYERVSGPAIVRSTPVASANRADDWGQTRARRTKKGTK